MPRSQSALSQLTSFDVEGLQISRLAGGCSSTKAPRRLNAASHCKEMVSSWAGGCEALPIELPDTLATLAGAPHQACGLHYTEMLGNCLATDVEACREPADRHRASIAEAGEERQARFLAQSCEQKGGGYAARAGGSSFRCRLVFISNRLVAD